MHGAEPWVIAYFDYLKRGGTPIETAPARLRRLTLEEAAELQNFPRDFEFHGDLASKFRQVGNAVPPTLGYHMALAVLASLGLPAPLVETGGAPVTR